MTEYISDRLRASVKALLILGSSLGTSATVAATNEGSYLMQGSSSCAEALQAAANPGSVEYFAIRGWVAGYLTAYNARTLNTYSILGNSDLGGAMLWISSYCARSPLDNVGDAAVALTHELHPKRLLKKN